MRRVADEIANWLVERRIFTAFGIVGGGNVVLFDAIKALGKTKIVACHHEQAAAMASTYFNRVRGGLDSVVLVTTGAGSTNAITGVMAAYMDGCPLLVISGNEASKYMGGKTRVLGTQGYKSSDMAGYCAKFCQRIMYPELCVGILDKAHSAAVTPPQGPVWCDLPKDTANALVN